MDHYLRGGNLQEIAEKGSLAQTMREHFGLYEHATSRDRKIATFQDLNLAYSRPLPSRRHVKLSPADRIGNFKEINLGMNPEEAGHEAGRCMSCGVCTMCGNCYLFCPDGAVQLDSEIGHYAIDYDYCKGCGVCQNECPVGAIIMETEGEG
jgi:2-oxoacid:acceptor oxidoreductase delta subunit (pyruvate/2-ketoisovalerate family)